MVAQDALSGAVDVLVMARRVLGEPLECSALRRIGLGNVATTESLSTPPHRVKRRSEGAGATPGLASQQPKEGKAARQATSP